MWLSWMHVKVESASSVITILAVTLGVPCSSISVVVLDFLKVQFIITSL